MKIIKVIKNINQGGFGIIDEVLCEDGGHYARKTFRPSDIFQADEELCSKLKARFVREVKTQKVLPDDYFIPILFDDLNVSSPYFIMPLADDVYTSEIANCKSQDRSPEGLGDILNGLEFLHEKGLVHRDLKPQNILKHNGIWKLADFGLISQDKKILSKTITTSKNAYGTVMYCSPEQVVEFSRITPQADIYSFGAILHDIFTGGSRVPYSELSAEGKIGQIIEKCTKHKKEQRFKNIKSLRSKLLTLLIMQKSQSDNVDPEWQEKFKDNSNWDEDTFESFIFYLKRNNSFANVIFYEITEDIILKLESKNYHLFNELALLYLDWVYRNSYQFSYCDVIVNNIYCIYNVTRDIEVKSKCAISSAELGRSHNRWYVMRYVVKMSDDSIDENLAFRIGMDIALDPRNIMNFEACVKGINLSTKSYHPLINTLVKDNLHRPDSSPKM